jgi:LysM repeat protein
VRWSYWSISIVGLAALTAWQYRWPPFDGNGLRFGRPAETAAVHPGESPESEGDSDDALFESDAAKRLNVSAQREPALERPAEVDRATQFDPPFATKPASGFPTRVIEPNTPESLGGHSSAGLPSGQLPRESPSFVRHRGDHETVTADAEKSSQPTRQAGAIQQVSSEADAPADSWEVQLREIDRLLAQGELIAAHGTLSSLYWNRPEWRPFLQDRIDSAAHTVYFAPGRHLMEPYVIQPGDQLRLIARRYQVPWEYLAQLNRVDPKRIRPGQRLKVIKGPFAALIDLGRFELSLHAHGFYVRRYAIGIGKDESTPTGTFRVLEKVTNPQYTDPNGQVIDADDPANPLGERWLDLGNGYGIHGTVDASSIGRAESRGCIRLHNDHAAEVYDLLSVGSEVVIRP